MLAAPDVEDELAHERLMVFLAEHLVALREVVAFLHLQTFERLDELHRVLAAAEPRFLYAEFQGVHRLIIRLHEPIGQWTGGIERRADGRAFVPATSMFLYSVPSRSRSPGQARRRQRMIQSDRIPSPTPW